jgi:hypothetical protein
MPSAAADTFEEFTEAGYRSLLATARTQYAFERFGTHHRGVHVLWRHDVDMSMHRALRLARIEADSGVVATYFFLLHSRFYNLLENSVFELAREIARCGHHIGLHFDPQFNRRDDDRADLEQRLTWERRILQDLFGDPIEVFSFHNPDTDVLNRFDQDELAGMVNTYGRTLRNGYVYCSDSNGYWRHHRLADVLASRPDRLHVLTHPEWWVQDPMSPRQRVERCIQGRSIAVGSEYDRSLLAAGRRNLGKDQNA